MLDSDLWRDMEAALAPVEPLEPLVFGDLSMDETVDAMARRVLANAPEQFDLLGFSMGSFVAREVARMAPKRVRRLILVASALHPDSEEQVRQKESAIKQMADVPFTGLSRGTIGLSLHESLAHDDALIERIRAMNVRLGKDVFARQARLLRVTDENRLAEITCPTLVIGAADDRLRPVAESRMLAAGIPGASLQVMEGVGHMIPLEAPEDLAERIVTWLAAVRNAGGAGDRVE